MIVGTLRFLLRLWRRKWNIARLLLAGFLLWVLAADATARLARLQLAALPGFDYAGEVRALRLQGRFGEADVIARQGLDDLTDPAARATLQAEADLTAQERSSWIRRAKDAGLGALSGRATTLEGLIGALAADFFIVGDLRDLVIEGGKQVIDGDSDELVLLLSVAGVVTTLAPEIDWAPAILKAARKAGAVSERLTATLTSAIKARRTRELVPVFEDVAQISRKASPGGAIRVLRLADSPEDLRALARFIDTHPAGAFSLAVTGERGSRTILKEGLKDGLKDSDAAAQLVIRAAKKGSAGASFLTTRSARALLRPHPLIGLLKGLQKGTLADAARKFMDRLDPAAWWILPALAGWTFIEASLLIRGLAAPHRAGRPASGVRVGAAPTSIR